MVVVVAVDRWCGAGSTHSSRASDALCPLCSLDDPLSPLVAPLVPWPEQCTWQRMTALSPLHFCLWVSPSAAAAAAAATDTTAAATLGESCSCSSC